MVEVENHDVKVVYGYENVAHVLHVSDDPENERGVETVVACNTPPAVVESTAPVTLTRVLPAE